MWPIIDKRNKKRRNRLAKKNKYSDRRKEERRSFRNWIELYLNDDDSFIS